MFTGICLLRDSVGLVFDKKNADLKFELKNRYCVWVNKTAFKLSMLNSRVCLDLQLDLDMDLKVRLQIFSEAAISFQ